METATGAATAIERSCVAVRAVGVVESATRTVNAEVPAAVGVPLIWPVEASSARPAGSAPAETDHAYGAAPPVAASAWL